MRTLGPGRRQENIVVSQKREHSRKPDQLYTIIESCSPGPYLELFARCKRDGWTVWGDEPEKFGDNGKQMTEMQLRLLEEQERYE
jgi:N6-adenosine-specific RNA methylase IME4